MIHPSANADDVIAFVAGCIVMTGIDNSIKVHLDRFLDAMDARAVAKHGYSDSLEEQRFLWTPLADADDE